MTFPSVILPDTDHLDAIASLSSPGKAIGAGGVSYDSGAPYDDHDGDDEEGEEDYDDDPYGGDDDSEPPGPATLLSISPASLSGIEGDAGVRTFSFTVSRTGDVSGYSSVSWWVMGLSADAADFSTGRLPSGTLTLLPGQTSQVIQILVRGDVEVEPDKSFTVSLFGPVDGDLAASSATGTIINDDLATSLDLSPAVLSLVEGDEGFQTYTYTATRSGDISGASAVAWSVEGSGRNPANAADFRGGVLPSGILTFESGETSKTIQIEVAGDRAFEPDEQFTVSLVSASQATIGAAQASGVIVNDDVWGAPPLIFPQVQVLAEGGDGEHTVFTFIAMRFGDLGRAVSGTWSLQAPRFGPAASSTDFLVDGGVVSFAAGAAIAQIVVTVVGDDIAEPSGGFEVIVEMAGLSAAIGRGLIINDDVAGVGAATPLTMVEPSANLIGVHDLQWSA